jgi:hypothetical protein
MCTAGLSAGALATERDGFAVFNRRELHRLMHAQMVNRAREAGAIKFNVNLPKQDDAATATKSGRFKSGAEIVERKRDGRVGQKNLGKMRHA